MRRIASSRVYITRKEFYTNHVVELFNSFVVNHYALHNELAMTEWLGGVIVFVNTNELIESLEASNNVETIEALFEFALSLQQTSRQYAYHITNMDIVGERLTSKSRITLLQSE